MITATITKHNNVITGFDFSGHAGYDEAGLDIICAAVSAMALNTVNSIMAFTDDEIECSEPDDEEGILRFSVKNPSDESILLMNSLELGLGSVVDSYGNEFLEIITKIS